MRESDVYEMFVRDIFESLGKLDGVQKLKVERNVYLAGLATNADGTHIKHQIDVCVTYEQFGMKHLIVIQAKNWNNPVDLPTLMTFKGVLSDLPGSPRGILVTKTGFDKGNIFGVARTYNIGLYVLDEIAASEFAPSMEITGEMTVDGVSVNAFDFGDPYDENLARKILDSETDGKKIKLYAEDGRELWTLDEAIDDLLARARAENVKNDQSVFLQFTIPGKKVYLHTGDPKIPRLQLARIVGKFFRKLLASGKSETKLTHTLQLLTNDETYYIDSDHNVHKRTEILTGLLQLKAEHEGQVLESSFAMSANLSELEEIHKAQKRRDEQDSPS